MSARGHAAQPLVETITGKPAVPPADPAPADLWLWLWAAFPPRSGQLHVARIAQGLGVSESTVRRWVREAHITRLNEHGRRLLHRRAILRGRGHYLWPDSDDVIRGRAAARLRHATGAAAGLELRGPTTRDRDRGIVDPHLVHLVHHPRGHVFGVTLTSHPKALSRANRLTEVLHSVELPNRWAAEVVKYQVLAHVEQQCVAAGDVVPIGRTEVWREMAGPVDLQDFMPPP